MRGRGRVVPVVPGLLLAGVFLLGGGPNHPTGDGGFLRWNPGQPVPFTIDNGPLGPLSNAAAASMVREAAAKWTDVATASIVLRDNGFLSDRGQPIDVDGTNYRTFFGIGTGRTEVRPENPVVFDHDGRIIDDFLGSGASNSTLGFAGVRFALGNEYRSAWAVLNGKKASDHPTFSQTVLHELGHFLGLDHTQGLYENYQEFSPSFSRHIPVMFPIGGIPGMSGEPLRDDRVWLSWLYPAPGFFENRGVIRGRVFRLRHEGPALQGANVAAIPAVPDGSGGFTPGREDAVTVVSDFLATGTGEFELPGLPPGRYFVRLDRLRPSFTGGSGIGPFDERPANFPTEFWHLDESAFDDPEAKTVIQVSAGGEVTGIDLVANEPQGVFLRLAVGGSTVVPLQDDDARLVLFPERFVFPFFGELYREVYVNSDGNLTFRAGDAQPGAARTEARFLSGPPRIAPLFTDLDPSASPAAQIRAETGDGFVRFVWDRVPEFAESGTAAPNTFSATLFDTGDVQFDYQQVTVTPDPDAQYLQGLHSVVGISPGGGAPGRTVGFAAAGTQDIGDSAVYQVFPGNTFNLSGRTVRFQAALTELFFPLLSGDSREFTGFAVTAYGAGDALVTAEARNEEGAIQTLPRNPSSREIPAGAQLAELGRELFGLGPATPHSGWVRMLSTRPEVASFFQFGNGLIERLTKMDGSAAILQRSPKIHFTRLIHGPGTFPNPAGGREDAETVLLVVNPNNESVSATLRLFNQGGFQVGVDVVRNLEPWGRLSAPLSDLFSLGGPWYEGFVEVESDGPGLAGFQLIELADTLLGLNAQPASNATVAYSAQLAHGADIFTSLKVVNPTTQSLFLTITAYLVRGDGGIDTRLANFALQPRQSIDRNVDQLFGLGPGGTVAQVGSIVVESTGPGVLGDVVFGESGSARYAAALPLQTRLLRRAVHSQVSNGVDPTDPALSSFTGLALFNPAAQNAQVTVEVFDRHGNLVGLRVVQLGPRQRDSRTLAELVPASQGLVRGYVRLTANLPIVAQQLFGNSTLDYLSAVVPTVLE
jgi:hypothetical protein